MAEFRKLAGTPESEARELARKAAREREAHNAAQARKMSCSAGGVATVWAAAVLSTRLKGLPDRIDLSSPNGYNAGLVLRFSDGVWNLGIEGDALAHRLSPGQPWLTHQAGVFLKAVGVHTVKAMAMVTEMLRWEPGVLRKAAASVPLHVLAATFARLDRLGHMFLTPPEDADALRAEVAEVVREAGIDLSKPLPSGMTPFAVLAFEGAPGTVAWALQEKLLSPSGADAVEASFEAAKRSSPDMLRAMHRNGVRMDVRSPGGGTLLHAAVSSDFPADDPEGMLSVVDYLLRQGLDPTETDAAGRTAVDLAHAYAGGQAGERVEALVGRYSGLTRRM